MSYQPPCYSLDAGLRLRLRRLGAHPPDLRGGHLAALPLLQLRRRDTGIVKVYSHVSAEYVSDTDAGYTDVTATEEALDYPKKTARAESTWNADLRSLRRLDMRSPAGELSDQIQIRFNEFGQ
ncbi:hypothetical protein ACFLWB_01040 [Chloroflexota bacterium]